MGLFDRPGEFDESSVWYPFRDPAMKAADQAVKARREAASHAVRAASAQASLEDRVARLEEYSGFLEQRIAALGLYARTILHSLQVKAVLAPGEFEHALEAVDLLDGKRDGR